MQIIRLKDIGSTNEYLLRLALQQPGWEGAVMSEHQNAGKGMGNNKWESEVGKNLLFSILLHPTWLPIHNQYLLSMAEAVAIHEVLSEYVQEITIKWPNDIYWRNRKISGTRIDTNIIGNRIGDMIIGTGININQKTFISDAPNPVSLWQITHTEYNITDILHKILAAFEHYYTMMTNADYNTIIHQYHINMYRRKGFHKYRDTNGEFEAAIKEVLPNGILKLQRTDYTISEYLFKEVEFIIPNE